MIPVSFRPPNLCIFLMASLTPSSVSKYDFPFLVDGRYPYWVKNLNNITLKQISCRNRNYIEICLNRHKRIVKHNTVTFLSESSLLVSASGPSSATGTLGDPSSSSSTELTGAPWPGARSQEAAARRGRSAAVAITGTWSPQPPAGRRALSTEHGAGFWLLPGCRFHSSLHAAALLSAVASSC